MRRRRRACTDDQSCPAGVAPGVPCGANDDTCGTGNQRPCYCDQARVWRCF